MFDHITLGTPDIDASAAFYVPLLAGLGYPVLASGMHAGERIEGWEDMALAPASAERGAARGLHIAFVAPSREHVDAFWRAGTEAGHPDAGPPGPRPEYGGDYYGAFLRSPEGNSVEAVHGGAFAFGAPEVETIDHLWIRVADLAASVRFYTTIAAAAGIRQTLDEPERARFGGPGISFTLVPGAEPTEHVHIAFGTTDDADVEEFHRVATEAGYRDNGGPGERTIYHPGYYGSFVLDPDGHNVEVVNHHRG